MTSSLNSKTRLSKEGLDERSQATVALLAFSIAIVGVVIAELLVRLAVAYAPASVRYWAITLINGTLFPICALSAWSSRGLGGRSILISLGSLATLWTALMRFRGLWAWSGTFDAYWLSSTGWLLSAAAGFILGSLPPLFKRFPRTFPRWMAYASLGAILVAALIEYLGGKVFSQSIDSVYPETRHVFLIGIAVVLTVGLFAKEER